MCKRSSTSTTESERIESCKRILEADFIADYTTASNNIREYLTEKFPEYHVIMTKPMTDLETIFMYSEHLFGNIWQSMESKTIMVFLGYHWSLALIALKVSGVNSVKKDSSGDLYPCTVYVMNRDKNYMGSLDFGEVVDPQNIGKHINNLIGEDDVTCVCCLDTRDDMEENHSIKPIVGCSTCSAYMCRKCLHSSGVYHSKECIVCKCPF